MKTETQNSNHVELIAPEGATSVNHGGQIYEVVEGRLFVPADAAELLSVHGYFPVPVAEEVVIPKAAPKNAGKGNAKPAPDTQVANTETTAPAPDGAAAPSWLLTDPNSATGG